MTKLNIEVQSYTQYLTDGAKDLKSTYDINVSPLALIDMKFHIGMETWDKLVTTSYDQVIDEYAVWLEDRINAQDMKILEALDAIFTKAQRGTVVLLDSIQPGHSRSAGTEIRRKIMELAGAMEE